MAEEIDALKRYRAGLLKQGRLHDADMVAKCIRLVRSHVNAKHESESAPDGTVGKNVGKTEKTGRKPA